MRTLQARRMLCRLAILCAPLTCGQDGQAQAIKVMARVPVAKPQAVCLLCTLTVAVSPATLNFTLVQNGTAQASASLTIVTTLTGAATVSGTANLYAYFANSAAALTGAASSSDVLPSSAILGRCTTGLPTTFTAFTQTAPFGGSGASLEIFTQSVNGVLLPASRTDTLALEINLAGLSNVAADTYSGVLIFQAEQF